jgi:NAD(P)-dependent dehydrogenase (short-subunit alcohol dehydrogenase family)
MGEIGMTANLNRPVAVIAGAGPGNGEALARRFADAGYAIGLLARNPDSLKTLASRLPDTRGYVCDVANADSVSTAFARIRSELGSVDMLLFNAGSAVFGDFESITPEQFEDSWRVNALGGLLCAKEVVPAMVERGRGSVIFIGATASRRGGANTAAFAPAKAAQKSLAESMARKLWPKGIHVALVVVDGIVDLPGTREHFSDRQAEAFVSPAALADTVHSLTIQDRRAWSFEIEARPFLEPW